MDKRILDAQVSVKQINKENSTIDFVFSTSDRDRHGDIVHQNWDLGPFRKNPVFINSHDYSDAAEVIGKIENAMVKGGKLEGRVKFAVDENPKAKVIFDLYAGGYLHATSVGFIPQEFNEKGEILKSELLEVSAVSVPANAMATAKAKGIDVDALDEEDIIAEEPETKTMKMTLTQDILDLNPELGEFMKLGDEFDIPIPAETKDVMEVVNLAYIASDIAWLLKAFAKNEVKETVLDKMSQALELIMAAIKEEAKLGKKDFRATVAEKEAELATYEAAEPVVEPESTPDTIKTVKTKENKNNKVLRILDGAKKELGELRKVETRPEDVRAKRNKTINKVVRQLIAEKK